MTIPSRDPLSRDLETYEKEAILKGNGAHPDELDPSRDLAFC